MPRGKATKPSVAEIGGPAHKQALEQPRSTFDFDNDMDQFDNDSASFGVFGGQNMDLDLVDGML